MAWKAKREAGVDIEGIVIDRLKSEIRLALA
jgi:hypothetical protein